MSLDNAPMLKMIYDIEYMVVLRRRLRARAEGGRSRSKAFLEVKLNMQAIP